ncbi:hypothetical protein [Bacterioplanoides sp.]|uniref:hypothetical protein n=1 Tax=Bacterioplanoides sp. TaxID=2066072 RepID=UPI003B00A6CE
MKKSLLGIILSIFLNHQSNAGIKLEGEITELWVNDVRVHNAAFVSVGENYQSPCNSGVQSRYIIIDLADTDPSMKNAFSMVLAAYMSGKPVTLGGTGECFPGTNNEKLKYLFFGDYN